MSRRKALGWDTPSHGTMIICLCSQNALNKLFFFLLFSSVFNSDIFFFFAKVCYQTQFEFLILIIYSKFILLGTVSWLNSKPEFKLNNLTIIIIYFLLKSHNSNWNSKFSFKLRLHFQLHSTGIFTVMQRGTKIYQLQRCTCKQCNYNPSIHLL